jgi:hypothetical protein
VPRARCGRRRVEVHLDDLAREVGTARIGQLAPVLGGVDGARADRPQDRGPRALRARGSRWTPVRSGPSMSVCSSASRQAVIRCERGRPSRAWSRHGRIVRHTARPCRAGDVDRRLAAAQRRGRALDPSVLPLRSPAYRAV